MLHLGQANSIPIEVLKWLLVLPQPLFLTCVLVPSILFDPVFHLPFIALNIFFTSLMTFYCWALYILRHDEFTNLRTTLIAVSILSIAMWLLLTGVDDNMLYKRIWTGIYFQNVCLQTILFTNRNKGYF